jgi:peptide/nickel transport system substrate-binding protein
MHRSRLRGLLLAASVAAAPVAVTACGGGGGGGGTSGASAGANQGQQKGGTLNVISNSDFDHVDPGLGYYQTTYEWMFAADRPLYSYKPDDPLKPVPDLASGPPIISKDAKTVTFHIKKGIKFSPPVNREVTAADVKYAMERGFTKQVPNGYAGAYFGSIVGAPKPGGNYKAIPGIQTQGKYTLVLKLSAPLAGMVAQAVVLPLSAPVPKEYAFKYDQKNPSSYDMHQVATGPYMVQRVGGKVNYVPGKQIVLVRNPNWNPKTDYRPAYVDKINWSIGADPTVLGRQVLTGSDSVNGDTIPAAIVKLAAQRYRAQLTTTGGGSNRYIALNTTMPPFNNANLRKAVYAATDKRALQLTRGGPLVGDIATHYISPGVPGFEQAGGFKGPKADFNSYPNGSMTVAKKYLKAAGFSNGKYHGPRILMVGDNSDPASKTAQVVLQELQSLGFNVNFKSVQRDSMYTQFCDVPAKKVQVCPNVGWLKDFNDGYAWLAATFHGKNIVPVNNTNWPQLNDPKINKDIDAANKLVGLTKRADAWGKVDRDITLTAAAIPWFWDKQANVRSKNVKGVIAKWNQAWDLSFTSVK